MKTAAAVVTIFALIGGVVGAVDYFAKDEDLEQVSLRLDDKIRDDNVMYLERRIWQLEDRYKGIPKERWPQDDLNEYRELRIRVQMEKRDQRRF